MRVTRCPRCRAEDIAADAHPSRVLNNGAETRVFVCRGCYRPTELEYRIACDTTGTSYRPLPIREALAGLHDFYVARLAESEDPDRLVEDDERAARSEPIRAALADVDRRLAIRPVGDPGT
ncbi:MAG TPA: hypothetical protein VGS17_12895 [Candidatus Limnocylindria bacterium]|nr:hypothetical protein [Candidatus Limnocylindria bacterium]